MKSISSRSVKTGGITSGNLLITGNNNKASMTYYKDNLLPPSETVNIRIELEAIRRILNQLNSPINNKIGKALTAAEEEINKSLPDKDLIGKALERALKLSTKADNFIKIVDILKPHAINASAWLGSNWHKILNFVGG